MNREDVISLLNDSSRALIDMMAAKAIKSVRLRQQLIDIALMEIPQVSSRASRVIGSVVEMDVETLTDFSKQIIPSIPAIKDSAIRRSFLKIFTEAPLPRDEEEEGILLNSSFTFLIDPDEPIAVKIYCMDILYRFTGRYPEIAKELLLTLEELTRRDSSAIHHKGKYIIHQLQMEKYPAF